MKFTGTFGAISKLDDVEKLLHFCNFLAILKNNKLEFILANIFLYQLPIILASDN